MQILRRCLAIVLAGCLMISVGSRAPAGDAWPQFLGPARTGISSETGLIDAWPDDGPPQVWRVKGGIGMSGMAIAGGRLVTMIQDEKGQQAIALDAARGRQSGGR